MSVSAPPQRLLRSTRPPYLDFEDKLLLGAGPANTSPRVSKVLARQQVPPVCDAIDELIEDIKAGIRYVFQTNNEWTLVVSGSGHAAMECALCNCLERGERLLILSHGFWGTRVKIMSEDHGFQHRKVDSPDGDVFHDLSEIESHLKSFRPHAVFVCHGDSTTGVLQPLEGLGQLCHKYDSLLIADGVISVGAVPVFMDMWGIDVLYSATQKCIGGPAGAAPISFSPRAMAKIRSRKTPPETYYTDVLRLGAYWKCGKGKTGMDKYHHTPSSTLLLGLREALVAIAEEGLRSTWKRHAQCFRALQIGLKSLGLEVRTKAKDEHRLPCLTAVRVPQDVDCAEVLKVLAHKHSIYISGALGIWIGQIWRIGFMGYNARIENVARLLEALKDVLQHCRTENAKSKL